VAVFPAVDHLTPLVSTPYLLDHRELDAMVDGLEKMREMPDPLDTARATAALHAHLRIHLNKEDAHLYPILRERATEAEQASIGRLIVKQSAARKVSGLTSVAVSVA
jgi:iron-sulfur cluster repair protein YtfE (RIC family)